MQRKTTFAWPVVCVIALMGCSATPESPLSPSAAIPSSTAVNSDGSILKASAPTGLLPNGGVINTRRPTLIFNNAVGLHQAVGLAYDVEVQDTNGNVVYERTIGESAGGQSSHTLDTELSFSDTFWFRVRARLGDQVGPWSGFADFRTPDSATPAPVAGPTPGGGLPFPVPAACGPGGPDNRFACASAVASLSAEWNLCASGRGIGCHRFTRQVAYALSLSDPNWAMIQAAPGGHACNCSGCGGSDGTMLREDTVVYGGNRVFDMVIGAGGPSPSLGWSSVVGPRPGDIPVLPPLCQ